MPACVLPEAPSRAIHARLRIVQLTRHAGTVLVGTAVTVNTVLGLLPVVFIVATSLMIGNLPRALAEGTASPA